MRFVISQSKYVAHYTAEEFCIFLFVYFLLVVAY